LIHFERTITFDMEEMFMRNFVYVIGSTDDFCDETELRSTYLSGNIGDKNASVYEFDLSESSSITGCGLSEIATLIGQGMAFESWSQDGTYSLLIEK